MTPHKVNLLLSSHGDICRVDKKFYSHTCVEQNSPIIIVIFKYIYIMSYDINGIENEVDQAEVSEQISFVLFHIK